MLEELEEWVKSKIDEHSKRSTESRDLGLVFTSMRERDKEFAYREVLHKIQRMRNK